MDRESTQPKIAVIGSGISGIGCAYLLSQKYQVTLFEKNKSLGGHTHTHVIATGPDQGTGIDMGFIVLNDRNYPNLIKLFQHWEIKLQKSSMSFSYEDLNQNLYFGSRFPQGIFASAKARQSMPFYKMLFEILKFNQQVPKFLKKHSQNQFALTVKDFLDKNSYSVFFRKHYLYPTAAAIWSCPDSEIEQHPAHALFEFFQNHGLLSLFHRPQWFTVAGGSHSYLKRFQTLFSGKIVLESQISGIERHDENVEIQFSNQSPQRFDYVVLATHADEALQLLNKPSPEEKNLLGAFRYSHNLTVLHTDEKVMPKDQRIWSSWNYQRQKESLSHAHKITLSYGMNRLQNLKTQKQYFVTLNPAQKIDPEKILSTQAFTHPIFDEAALKSQKGIEALNGTRRSYFAGAYLGNGFHEDGLCSAIRAVKKLGVSFL